MKKILIIAAICLQFLALAGEQNKPALGLSRKSAVELALRNNQDLKAVKEGINAARGGRASPAGLITRCSARNTATMYSSRTRANIR